MSNSPEPVAVREGERSEPPSDTPPRGEPPRTALPWPERVCHGCTRRSPQAQAGCTLACTARRPGPYVSWSECSRPVYDIAAHLTPRCRAKRPGTVASGVHRVMRSGPRALARSRGPAPPGRGQAWSGPLPRRRPTQISCVSTATSSRRHRRTASALPTACLIPSRFFATVAIPRKSPL